MKIKKFLKRMKKKGELDDEEIVEILQFIRENFDEKNPEITDVSDALLTVLYRDYDDYYYDDFDGQRQKFPSATLWKLSRLLDDYLSDYYYENYVGNEVKRNDIFAKKNEDWNAEIFGMEKPIQKTCPELEKKGHVKLGEKAFIKIVYLLEKFPTKEWVGLLKGRKDGDDEYYIDDLIVPAQENTTAHTQVSEEVLADISRGIYGEIIGWIHSHNGMSAFFSGEDEKTNEKFDVSIVVNNRLEMKCALKKKLPCGRTAIIEGDVELSVESVGKDFVESVEKNVKISEFSVGIKNGNIKYYVG